MKWCITENWLYGTDRPGKRVDRLVLYTQERKNGIRLQNADQQLALF
jgi:hypothetical protein